MPYPFKLLYVEDDAELRKMMRKKLQDMFEQIYTANDGDEGISHYKKYVPDIIISDLSMPKMNGLEMAAKIRQTDKNIPIIILTAFSELNLLMKASEAGIIVYLVKPVEIEILREAVKKSLGSRLGQ
jgi:CheY-like chemotaxis protein